MAISPDTRPSLLVRIRDAQDMPAWGIFVEVYAPLIHGYLRKRGLQDADAADVTQEVLRRVASAIRRFDYDPQRGGFRGWLFTVVRNQWRSFLERKAEPGSGDSAAMQIVHLYGSQRPAMLLHLQVVEIIRPRPCLPQHALHRSGIDVANVRRSRDRAAMAQTLENTLERVVGQLRVLPQGAGAFAEAFAAVRAIQSANVLGVADPFDDAKIAGVESIEGGTIFIGARQVRQRVRLAA